MFGLGFTEIIVIFVVALIFLGPKELPRLGTQLGKFLRVVNLAKHEFELKMRDLNREVTKESQVLTEPLSSVTDTLKASLKPVESASNTLSALSSDLKTVVTPDAKEDRPT